VRRQKPDLGPEIQATTERAKMRDTKHSEWHARQAQSAGGVHDRAAGRGQPDDEPPVDVGARVDEAYAAAVADQSAVDYQSLRAVLDAAYYQAAHGKGKQRHARGNRFERQHMQSISCLLDSDRGMAFQAIKKLTEGLDMADPEARERELLGAINYVAGIVVYYRLKSQEG
jgi:hypothetical protein